MTVLERQPGRYLSVNADFLPAHRSLSVLVFNIGWFKDKMPVLSTDWNHGALFHKQRRELNSVVVARGLSNLPNPADARSESWNGSRITRYKENEEQITISGVYKNHYIKWYTKWYNKWYMEPNFDTPFSTSNGPINSICWGLSHFVDYSSSPLE